MIAFFIDKYKIDFTKTKYKYLNIKEPIKIYSFLTEHIKISKEEVYYIVTFVM